MSEIPEFKPNRLEVWASAGLMMLFIFLATYTSWVLGALGPSASFHITHHITASWAGFLGVNVSLMATILAWRGFGLNAIAGLLASMSLSTALISTSSFGLSVATVVACGWLIAAIHYTRRYYEHNPLLMYLSLWGLTTASSLSQSIIYKYGFAHSYPLTGVLILKVFLFGLGGLAFLLASPRKNSEYVL